MLRICTKLLLPVLLTILGTACEPEQMEISELQTSLATENKVFKPHKRSTDNLHLSPAEKLVSENLQNVVLTAVSPSECGATKFNEVSGKYFEKLLSNPEMLDHLDHYKFLNRQATRLGIGTTYFGENGRHSKQVQKTERDLDRFFDLPYEIKVLGQHNNTLQDREKLAKIYWYSIQDMVSMEEAYILADKILELNEKFPQLIHSPFISSDGFAAQNATIVVGDGLIQLFSETGLPYEIVWTGIVSHEWAHQVQFHFFDAWYSGNTNQDPAERRRLLELEADFFSGYYMTHKRGATYNWKRAEKFFELFYQAGDCSFEFEQHHGTPLQRKQASYEGYLLAESAKKKGQILSAEELHWYFEDQVLPTIVQQLEYL